MLIVVLLLKNSVLVSL